MNALGWHGEPRDLLRGLGDLAARVTGSDESGGFQVVQATGLWTQVGYPIRKDFLDDVRAGVGLFDAEVDFASAPDFARSEINRWVAEKTGGQIGALFSSIPAATRVALANVISFKSRWSKPFTSETQQAPFRRLDGREIMVEMMLKQGGFRYVACAGDDFELIELPYQSALASMLVVVPRSGFFSRVERLLNAETLERAFEVLVDAEHSRLSFPKFTVSGTFPLEEQLARLGAPSVLTSAADLSGITSLREPWQGTILHTARITVDEKGTEAVAATVVYHVGGAPNEVVVDRPFLFFIRDLATGVILFSGRIVDPAGERA